MNTPTSSSKPSTRSSRLHDAIPGRARNPSANSAYRIAQVEIATRRAQIVVPWKIRIQAIRQGDDLSMAEPKARDDASGHLDRQRQRLITRPIQGRSKCVQR